MRGNVLEHNFSLTNPLVPPTRRVSTVSATLQLLGHTLHTPPKAEQVRLLLPTRWQSTHLPHTTFPLAPLHRPPVLSTQKSVLLAHFSAMEAPSRQLNVLPPPPLFLQVTLHSIQGLCRPLVCVVLTSKLPHTCCTVGSLHPSTRLCTKISALGQCVNLVRTSVSPATRVGSLGTVVNLPED